MTSTKEATAGLFAHAVETPFSVAPERAQELADRIFGQHLWELRPSEVDEAFFSAVVEDRRIYLSHAGLASLWCLAFVAYQTFDVGSRIAADPRFAEFTTVDLGPLWATYRLHDYLGYARRLCSKDEAWPDGLKTPTPEAALTTEAGCINNLFYGALSWVILHEIGHVHHQHPRLVGFELKISNEWQADRFATDWALRDAQGREREFRVLAICIAQAWLMLFEQARHGGGDHPPSILRFREAASWFEVPDDSPALEDASYLLKAIFDPMTPMPACSNARQAFDWVEARLVEIIGRPT